MLLMILPEVSLETLELVRVNWSIFCMLPYAIPTIHVFERVGISFKDLRFLESESTRVLWRFGNQRLQEKLREN